MTQIPKIGLQRLQKSTDLQVHPDAEIITTFIEGSITTRERAAFLDHLAQCYKCREIVSLALPQLTGLPAQIPAANPWLSLPMLRWVGAAACLVIVGTAVTLHFESRRSSSEISTRPVEVAALDRKVAVPPSPAPSIEQSRKQTAEVSKAEPANAPVRQKKAMARPYTSSISSDQTADVAAAEIEPNSQLQSVETLEARDAPTAVPQASVGIVPGRAKEAEPPIAVDSAAASAAKQQTMALSGTNTMAASRARLLPRWALNADGSLQRSRDGGTTWEIVSVAPQSRLHALAANGLDIWVGGSSGALYHSSDGGEHWSQVRPMMNGVALSADIIGVEFPDPQHGKISTSSLETWTTADAGQHWQKQ